jgi:CheY-like chemotaxis protein
MMRPETVTSPRRRTTNLIAGRHDDLLSLVDDEPDEDGVRAGPDGAWKVLIVDDDPSVHDATSYALSHLKVAGRAIHSRHAYSAVQAIEILLRETDIALALIDVVMETEHAGLDLVRQIREELDMPWIRLVIRTGQAGRISEAEIRRSYPVDDFCQKADLSAGRLRDLLIAQLDER